MVRITQIRLQQFRNHEALMLDTDAPAVIITGVNGIGKTNILEALSLCTVGRGLRHAALNEIHRHPQDGTSHKQWGVHVTMRNHDETHALLMTHQQGAARRTISFDDVALSSMAHPSLHHAIMWLTPTMSHMFQEGMTVRRKFFDRLAYGFDAKHATHVHAYDHYMRERTKLLMMDRSDAAWLDVLEQKMAEYAVLIARTRMHMARSMEEGMREVRQPFPHATLQIIGVAEQALSLYASDDEVIAHVRQQWQQTRTQDRHAGRCSIGAHKTRFEVMFVPTGRAAEQCSTGEQKALLLAFMCAHLYAHRAHGARHPILLLDEMVAHLDQGRRDALAQVLEHTQVQLFATGTDASDFSALLPSGARMIAL